METDLARLLERSVDFIPRKGVEQSEKYIRRRRILGSAQTISVACASSSSCEAASG